MTTRIDGHVVLALIAIPTIAYWAVGYMNYRLRLATRRRILNARGGAR